MQRRNFLKTVAATGSSISLWPGLVAGADVSANYAESVAVHGITLDGSGEFSFRLSRRPRQQTGTLWATVDAPDASYAVAIEDLELAANNEPTAVEDDHVVFRVGGQATAQFERSGLESAFRGTASTAARAHASLHPPVGPGEHPIRIDAEFKAWHAPVYPRPGRLEMMGTASGTLTTPAGTVIIDGVGAWHEQVGERPSFAPAFTYFKAMGDHVGVLASLRHDTNRAWGFGYVHNQVIAVRAFRIDGAERERDFEIVLADGQVINGKASRIRQHSVPIEGQRRPGTTVRVTASIGPMIGMLNDWKPA